MSDTYEYIVNRSHDFITLINRNYQYEIVNDSYCKAVEMDRSELVGASAAEVWGAERFQSSIKPRLDECLAGSEVHFVDAFRFGTMRKSLHVSFYPYGESSDEVTHALVFSHDITYLSEIETRLARYEYRDHTTGLFNRRALEEMLGSEIDKANRTPEHRARVLLFISLKNFKKVNQTYGHHIGDLLLEHTANRIKENVRSSDVVFRFGGTILAVLLNSVKQTTDAAVVAQKISDDISVPFHYRGSVITVDGFIGIGVFPDDAEDVDTLIQRANSSSVDAEEQDLPFRFYDQGMHQQAVHRMTTLSDLHTAMTLQQMELYYHPIVGFHQGKPTVMGAEALIRWNHPERGMVSPDDFIGIAEGSRLIAAIDKWALFHATARLSEWIKTYDLFVSLNVSADEFSDEFLPSIVKASIDQHSGLDPARLKLELTERRTMDNPVSAISQMNELLKIGVDLWIDDFGTGQSSLTYLKQLPAAALKIDRTFVDGMDEDDNDRRYMAGIVESIRARGKTIVVEGVTNEEQVTILHDLGCDFLQGYFYSVPVTADDFEQILKNGIPGLAERCRHIDVD